MRSIKTWDELTIRDNYIFQKVARRRPDLLQRLLERLLGFSVRMIDFPQTEKAIETDWKAKGVRLDVYVEDVNRRVYDIEMQASDMAGDELFLRTRYYQAMIDQGILEKGQLYSKLRESYIIFTCVFDPFGFGFFRYTFRNRCDESSKLVLPDRATRIFLNAEGTHGEEHPDIRGFLNYVRTNEASGGLSSEIAACVDQIKADEKEKEIYMSLAMDMQMYVEREKKGWWAEGKAEGRAEGRAEGKAEGRADILVNMLSSGQTPEQISRLTKVPLDEISRIQSLLARKQ